MQLLLTSSFFVVGISDVKDFDLNSSKIKMFTYGETFRFANLTLDRVAEKNHKLFFVTDLDLKDSIFEVNKTIKIRTKEIFFSESS